MTDVAEELRMAMRRWTSGITIVTAEYNGFRHGMTVSSFTSVSLQPPLVLVCIDRLTRTHELIQESGCFAACILHHDQRELSERFAGRVPEIQDRFEGLELQSLPSGLCVPAGCLASFDCRLVATHTQGRSSVFMAEVTSVSLGPQGPPLLYYNQDYHNLDL